MLLLNLLFGVSGIVWTQLTADCFNVLISYIIYFRVLRKIC